MAARSVVSAVAGLLVVALGGYGVADAYDRVPGVLTLAPRPTAPVSAPAASGPAAPTATSVAPLAPLPSGSAQPLSAAARAALAKAARDPDLGPSVGASVRDAASGAHLFDVDAARPRVPASTMKVLTAAAIIDPLGASTRFTTKAVQGAKPDQVVLVAGGDMLLGEGASNPGVVEGQAGLGTLATQTARALAARNVRKVTLAIDASYAAGPDFAPTWNRDDLDPGYVGKVGMLGLAKDLAWHGTAAELDPTGSAARAFAAALTKAGIQVAGEPGRAKAAPSAAVLGSVQSAPAADVLAVALARSDNALTEGLARQAALRAGVKLGASPFATVATWVRSRLATLGYDITGLKNVDVCGLSGGQLAPARLVADVVAQGASGKDPALQSVLAELPVGGLTGTLSDRFDTPGATAAAGLARAKTGTLTGVSAMAGTVVDRSGRLLAYEIVADKVPADIGTDRARAALDRFISALASL